MAAIAGQVGPGLARWDSLTVADLVERDGLDAGRQAIVFGDCARTYGELRDAARRVANALTGVGVETLDRVAVLTTNRLEFIEIEAGISAAHGIMVPLDWRLRDVELASLLRRSQARTIFVEDRFLPTILDLRGSGAVPELRTVITLGSGPGDLSYEELVGSSSPERPARRGRMEDPHEIIFTQVSSGHTPGVVWTNGTVIWNALQQITDFGLSPRHSTYAIADLCYVSGRHDFTWAVLHQGGTVHIKPSSGFDAEEVVRYVAEHRITHVLWLPAMLYEILRLPGLADHDLGALQMIMCGGQSLSPAMAQRAQLAFPQTDFVPVYGLPEGGCSLTFVRPQGARLTPGSVGKPAIHVELRLVDPDGLAVPPGIDGEILVRAPSVTPGYWDDPELTERLIVDDWLHTGDMGHIDDEGFLHLSGRKDDVIISGEMSVFPSEVENVLRDHAAVADVAVIGLPHDKWGETVCAVVEVEPGVVLDEQELIELCTQRLADYKKPRSVLVVDELPRTPDGEPRKLALREHVLALESQAFPQRSAP